MNSDQVVLTNASSYGSSPLKSAVSDTITFDPRAAEPLVEGDIELDAVPYTPGPEEVALARQQQQQRRDEEEAGHGPRARWRTPTTPDYIVPPPLAVARDAEGRRAAEGR